MLMYKGFVFSAPICYEPVVEDTPVYAAVAA